MKLEEYLKEHSTILSFEKGQKIFSQGEKNLNIYFIQEGLVKAFYTSFDGKESVKSFILPGEFIGSLRSMYMEQEASFSTVCLEDTVTLVANFKDFYGAASKDLELCNILNEGLLGLSQKKEMREYEFLNLTPEERYLTLRERKPVIIEKVTQNDIARYLGITPVALSRIRKRISNI